MRVLLKLVLDCKPEAAWRAIRSPAVLQRVSSPLMTFDSLNPNGFPELWSEGEHPVRVAAFGLVPLGEQVIAIDFPPPRDGAMIMRDRGYGVRGVFTAVTSWEHTMAVSPAPGGGTLYRDRLSFEAGALTPLLWPLYWAFWQWRAIGMKRASLDS